MAAAKTRRKPAKAAADLAAEQHLEQITLYSRTDIATRLLKISMRKFEYMLATGEFPAPDVKIGDLPRWTYGTLQTYVNGLRKPK